MTFVEVILCEITDNILVIFYREQCIEVFFYQFYALLKADPYNISFLSGKVRRYTVYMHVSCYLRYIQITVHVYQK